MGEVRRSEVPALVVLVVDAAGALGFGLTYSALLGYLLVTSSEAELIETYPAGARAAALLLLLTLAITAAGVAAAVTAVRLARDRRKQSGAVVVLAVVALVTGTAAFTAHGGFDPSRSPRWLLVAAVHGAALAALRWRGGRAAPDP